MDSDTRPQVKIEPVDEVDVLPTSMESTTMDLEAKVDVKYEESDEVDVPSVSTAGEFAAYFFPEYCDTSIKQEEDVPLTEHAVNTESTTGGSDTSTTQLGCRDAVGLKTHISTALRGLLDRAPNNLLGSGVSPCVSAQPPSLGQPAPSSPHEVAGHHPAPPATSSSVSTCCPRPAYDTEPSKQVAGHLDSKPSLTGPALPHVTAPSSTPSSTSTYRTRPVYNTELVKQLLRQMDSKPGSTRPALQHVTARPGDASQLQPLACMYCQYRFGQQSTLNAHMDHAHPHVNIAARVTPGLTGLQPQSSCSTGGNDSHPQGTVPRKVHAELATGPDESTHSDARLRAQQTIFREDDSNYTADNERLTEDPVCEFTCDSCQMCFSSKYSLIMHVFLHIDGVEPPSNICRRCGNVYLSGVGLSNHLRMGECDTVLAPGKLYKHYTCDKSLVDAEQLRAHEGVHPVLNSHKCHICGRFFPSAVKLEMHAIIHSTVKEQECHVCNKSFLRDNSLKSHMLIHSEMRQHRCHVCGKSFHRDDYLKKHMQIHSGMNPYKCDVCGKSFRSAYDLKGHVLVHSAMRPHKCHVCSKLFSSAYQLKIHMKISS